MPKLCKTCQYHEIDEEDVDNQECVALPETVLRFGGMPACMYHTEKTDFEIDESGPFSSEDEKPKKVIITTNLIYGVMKVKSDRPLLEKIDGAYIKHYADQQEANIAKIGYLDKGYEVKTVFTGAGVEELLKGEQK